MIAMIKLFIRGSAPPFQGLFQILKWYIFFTLLSFQAGGRGHKEPQSFFGGGAISHSYATDPNYVTQEENDMTVTLMITVKETES